MTGEISNTYKEGRRKENSQKSPVTTNIKEDRNTNEKNTKITVADNAEHQPGPDTTYVHQERSIVENAKRGDTMKKCAAYQKEIST